MRLPEKYESIFDVSSEGPSTGKFSKQAPCLLNFPTKGLCSKRRRYFHIFQVEAYLTYCEDIYEVSTYTAWQLLFMKYIRYTYVELGVTFAKSNKDLKAVLSWINSS